MSMSKIIILLQVLDAKRVHDTNKMLIANKINGVEGNNKLIKKLVKSKTEKLLKD